MKSYYIRLCLLVIFFVVSCGGGGSSTPPTPTASLSASIQDVEVGKVTTLTWSSTNATACSATGSWSGSKAVSGSEEVTVGVAGSNTFNLACSNADATLTGSASVTVSGYRITTGVVVDGYISGASIFIDENNDYVADSNENSTTSDNEGKFTIRYANGSLVSIGGTDLDSSTPFDKLLISQKLTGYSEFKTVTPVTTIAAFMSTPSNVNAVLGIDQTIDIYSFDPVANKGDNGINDYLYEKGNQLTVLAYSLQNITNNENSTTDTSQDFFKAIAEEIETEFAISETRVDIVDELFIKEVLENVIAAKTLSILNENLTNTAKALSAVMPVIEIKSSDALTTSVQRFALNTFQNDIQTIANGEATSSLIGSYTSDTLNYIANDQSIDAASIAPGINAYNDSATMAEDTSVEISVLPNDSYLVSSPITVTAINGDNGTVSVTNNVITYTPFTNYNGNDTVQYTINQGNQSSSANVTITVTPVQDPPSIDTSQQLYIPENQTLVGTIAISDPDASDTLTLSIGGGLDDESFTLSSSNVLSFKIAPDFETKVLYIVRLRVSDGQVTYWKDIAITITDVNDVAPSFTTASTFSLLENGAMIGVVQAADSDSNFSSNSRVTFSISGSEMLINPDGSMLRFVSLPDYETKNSYSATVTATDGVNTTTQQITVNIEDVADGGYRAMEGSPVGESATGGAYEALALSGDGLILAYSDGFMDSSITNKVKVMKFYGGEWSQLGNSLTSDGTGAGGFGNSVALSDDGTILAVGVTRGDDLPGLVEVFQYNSGAWSKLGSSIQGSEENGDYFGYSVDLSNDGTVLAVGSIFKGDRQGAASVYQYSSGTWSQLGSTLDGAAANDWYGRDVSLSGNGQILAVGGDRHDNGKGHVRVFEYTSGSWSQLGSDIDGDNNQRIGRGVALSDDGSIVAMGSNGGGVGKVYQLSSGSWSQLGLDQTLNIDGADNTLLGLSTSMSNDGTIVAFGAPALSEVETGAVLTLRYTSGNWDYFDVLTDSVPGRAEGWSSDISNDGTIIASGNYQTGDNKGRAQVGKFEIEN
ncbi:Ig-like domain-containing protein [Gammaproteobacteria bacterium]|nr:Ig-like domain-containing protein [Gammaproteobacteria bacterium]